MDKAVEYAKEIRRKIKAVNATKSERLKRDYSKSIKRQKNNLKYYCKAKGLSYYEVMTAAR